MHNKQKKYNLLYWTFKLTPYELELITFSNRIKSSKKKKKCFNILNNYLKFYMH